MIKKPPYLFFLNFESMCRIVSNYHAKCHDFDEKVDFLNYEFLIWLPTIAQ